MTSNLGPFGGVTAAALACVLACAESQRPEPDPCRPDSVAVTVLATPEGHVSWDPPCPMMSLGVEPLNGDAIWTITTDTANNGIAPPIDFGVTPAGTYAYGPTTALDPAYCYEVWLIRTIYKPDGLYYAYAGTTRFCP